MIRFVGYFEEIELMGLASRVEINARGETRVMATYKQKGKSSICHSFIVGHYIGKNPKIMLLCG